MKNNKWIEHVKAYSLKHNIKFSQAIKDPNCKKEYNSSK